MAKRAKTTKSAPKKSATVQSEKTSTGASPELAISQPSIDDFSKKEAPKPFLSEGDELPLNMGIPTQEEPPVVTAPVANKPKGDGKYVVPPGEENLFHVEIERRQFDPSTGERLSSAYVQKFNARDFANFEKNAKGLGFTINKVLHEGKLAKSTPKGGRFQQPKK